MVMDYGVMYEYAIDQASGQFKAPFNQLYNEARVATPADTAIVTPNSDTPYSILWMDLRAEPVVLCVPEIEKDRYYSVQLVSQYTYNFGYIGTRATGNGAGCYAVAGPDWTGDAPAGIAKVFQSETEFALALFRTQLFDPADIDKVKAIQAEYKVEPLSAFLGQPAPAAAPAIAWPKIDKAMAAADPSDTSPSCCSSAADRSGGGRGAAARAFRQHRHRARQAVLGGRPVRQKPLSRRFIDLQKRP